MTSTVSVIYTAKNHSKLLRKECLRMSAQPYTRCIAHVGRWRLATSFNRTWKNLVTCLWVLAQPLGTQGKVFEYDLCPTSYKFARGQVIDHRYYRHTSTVIYRLSTISGAFAGTAISSSLVRHADPRGLDQGAGTSEACNNGPSIPGAERHTRYCAEHCEESQGEHARPALTSLYSNLEVVQDIEDTRDDCRALAQRAASHALAVCQQLKDGSSETAEKEHVTAFQQ